MKKIEDYFDYLHFTECHILGFKWEQKKEPRFNSHAVSYHEVSNLLIRVRNLGILQGHPLNPPSQESSIIFWPKRCTCIFKQVKMSILQMNRYYEYPPGSKQFVPDPYQAKIEDVFSVDEPISEWVTQESCSVNESISEFFMEGMYQDPMAWIDWEIRSRSFALKINPKDEQCVLSGLEYSNLGGDSKQVEVEY